MKIPTPDEFAKAGGYKPFPGKWNRWLNAVLDEILSAQPVAGRHVTIDEHPGKGTVINVDDTSARRKATPPPHGGCAGCALPDDDCPHAICIDVQLADDDDTDGDVIDLLNSGDSTNIIGVFPSVTANGWELYGGSPETDIFIATANPRGDGLFHRIAVTFSRIDDSTVSCTLSVDGVSATDSLTLDLSALTTYNRLLTGSNFHTLGSVSDRTIRCVSLLANPDSDEEDFGFPPDPFDSLTTGASIVGGQLKIDSSGDAYATKEIDYDLNCAPTGACCFSDGTCNIETELECSNDGGTYQGDDIPCDPNPCGLGCSCPCSGGITVSITATAQANAVDNSFNILTMSASNSHTFTLDDILHGPGGCGAASIIINEPCVFGCDQPDPPENIYGQHIWSFSVACGSPGSITALARAEFACCVQSTDPCDPDNLCEGNVFLACSVVDQPPGSYSNHCEDTFSYNGQPCIITMDVEVAITCNAL